VLQYPSKRDDNERIGEVVDIRYVQGAMILGCAL